MYEEEGEMTKHNAGVVPNAILALVGVWELLCPVHISYPYCAGVQDMPMEL